MPNVADVECFAAASGGAEPRQLAELPRATPAVRRGRGRQEARRGAAGGLASRRPDWSLVLVGPVGEGDPRGDVDALGGLPNVVFAGQRPFDELPAWVAAADVGLIPYRHNRYTASVFPMKVYEYLAAGLPVVSTRLPALRDLEGPTFAEGVDEFEAAIEGALGANTAERRAARRELARSHSWESRIEEIGRLVAECETR